MMSLLNGVNTHYQHIGKTGKVIILLHGWGCTWEIWSPIISELSETYQLIIPDLPSFGKSAEPSSIWETTHFVQWLDELITEVSPNDEVVVVGHSFGGKIATMFATKQPKKLSQLIIVDASGLPDPLSAYKQLQEKVLGIMPRDLKDLFSESLKKRIAMMTGSSVDYRNASSYQRKMLRNLFKENLAAQLNNITTPTLIIWGKHDLDTPLHQGERFQQLIPHSQISVFESSQHFPFINESAKFISVLKQFIS